MNQYETYTQIIYINDISRYRTHNLPPEITNKNDQNVIDIKRHENDDIPNKSKAYIWLQTLYHKITGKRTNNKR